MGWCRGREGGRKISFGLGRIMVSGLLMMMMMVGKLTGDTGFHGHVAGCYELPTGEVVFDLTVADGNVFFFFPPDTNITPSDGVAKRNQLSSPTMRWIFDPKAKKSAVEYPSGTV